METAGPDGTVNWRCRTINVVDNSLNCDGVTYPIAGGGLQPVRINGTYNLELTMRIYNQAGNGMVTSPYMARISAAARDWEVIHETPWLTAIGAEREYSEWHTHIFYDNPIEPNDPLTIRLLTIGRQTSSFWTDFSLQFNLIRLTLNTSYDPPSAGLPYNSWLYGEYTSPGPPPPPAG